MMGGGTGGPSQFVPMPTEGIKMLNHVYREPTLENVTRTMNIFVFDPSSLTAELLQLRVSFDKHYNLEISLNKKKIALSMGLVLAAGVAHAQSSVTLYGIIDTGITFANNTPVAGGGTGDAWGMGSGSRIPSRWGLKGVEDLGGGLNAVFQLESGFNGGNGSLQQGGRLFGRLAYVGLDSRQYGTLTLGRQQTPSYKFGVALDPLNYSTYGFPAQDGQLTGRADNSVTYDKKLGPFEVLGLYSFGYESVSAPTPVPGNYRVGKEIDIGARYVQGPLNVTFTFEQRNGLAVGTENTDERRYVIGSTYALNSKTTLYAGYDLILNNVKATQVASASQWIAYGGLRYWVTPTVDVAAATYYHSYRNEPAHALSTGLSADYLLSKRTYLYVNAQYAINSSEAALSVTGWDLATSTTKVQTGANQLGVAAGIMHQF